jgi:hypothetical protein
VSTLQDPYATLLDLTRREHELIVAGDIDAITAVQASRDELIRVLPATPPTTARPLLMEAAEIQASTHKLLLAAKAQIASDLAATDRTADTARGYGRSSLAAPPTGPSFIRSA